MNQEKLEARRKAKKEQQEAQRIEREKNQKPVQEIVITIEWAKSRMWGSNPNAKADVHYKDGTWHTQEGYKASGCGYDKESTVIAHIFNDFLKYKLWALSDEAIKGGHGSMDKGNAPYGITCYYPEHRNFAGGIGTGCYNAISEYIGGKFEHVASGKTFDVYKYIDN